MVGSSMRQIGTAIVLSGVLLMGGQAAQAASCDGPILFGTTISETGPFSTLTPNWRAMTEAFAEEVNRGGGIQVKECNKRLRCVQF